MLEALEDFLAAADQTIAKVALRELKKQGLDIRLGTKVTGCKVTKNAVKVTYEDKNGEQSLDVDKLVVAVGRRPFTQDLAAESVGLKLDPQGRIEVDHHCRTGVDGIFAIGRRGGRSHAGPQGLGRRGRGSGDDCRAISSHRTRQHPLGHLHPPRDRVGR